MNLLYVLIIFVLVEEPFSAGEPYLLESNYASSPLALTKKRESSKLELAIPQKSELKNFMDRYYYAEYAHDDSEDGYGRPVEEFMIACRAKSHIGVERDVENNWRVEKKMPDYVSLFLLDNYEDPSTGQWCSDNAVPAIEKVETKNENGETQYCGESGAEIYNVGFWVSKKNGADIQLVPVYKMCHTSDEGKGTLFTVHRIESPTLLLQEVWEYYEPPNAELYKCTLDTSDKDELFLNKRYAYQFVGSQDMPLENWKTTTLFFFNYTLITLDRVLMKDMIAVDNYIRLFSRKTNKPLTLYSGVYRETVNKSLPMLPAIQVDSFWRIIMDDDGLSIIIVIQHTSGIKCSKDTFICEKPRVLADYGRHGLLGMHGCIYSCSVDDAVIKRLWLPNDEAIEVFKLPKLQKNNDLVLEFPREFKKGSESSKNEKKKPAKELPETVSISEFLGEVSFESALENADPNLVSSVTIREKTEAHKYGHYKSRRGGRGGSGGSGSGSSGGEGSRSGILSSLFFFDAIGSSGGSDIGSSVGGFD